ncbi:hypothetical protein QI069_11450 [Staphylococcus saprophyticus]|uniref:hypothetical protein n=1 Tax=Staphylococcus saprophyticus TaxID=29385 RepID=UPI0011A78F8A|nr:hypothetical protein [Staphylococcus saprophyticus]MDW4253773.1 hypothetical protein [Staphylococcus saprophyticus]MDW4285422.1 hypothetical protein [Staphylococcus saprophyticus]MDW4312424.1 hypothetical protein [Staphylococcus saprophyticus]
MKFLAEEKNKELIQLQKHGRFFKTVARDDGYVPVHALKVVVCKYHFFRVYPDHLKMDQKILVRKHSNRV